MKIQDEINEQLKIIPESYYDFLVYFSTGVFFTSGLLYLAIPLAPLFMLTKDISIFNSIILSIILFVFVTLQGQLASSFGGLFIKSFIKGLHKLFRVKRSNFYYEVLTSSSTKLSVDGYWNDLFWMYINHPTIAKIMIKRYARVKLSRANSFNCILLLLIYFVLKFSNRISSSLDQNLFLIIIIPLTIILVIEYWLRQSWFNDGLKKFIIIANQK